MPYQFIVEKFSSGQLKGGSSFCTQSELLCKDPKLWITGTVSMEKWGSDNQCLHLWFSVIKRIANFGLESGLKFILQQPFVGTTMLSVDFCLISGNVIFTMCIFLSLAPNGSSLFLICRVSWWRNPMKKSSLRILWKSSNPGFVNFFLWKIS